MKNISCVGCGALFPEADGPTHQYMESSPGCWATFGEVLAREYSDPLYAGVHRLTVDTYAVQHPGSPLPQAIRSVALHLISLCLVLEYNVAMNQAMEALRAAAEAKERFFWLTPPSSRGVLTVRDVYAARNPKEHQEAVRAWAVSSWSAWREHHETIHSWLFNLRDEEGIAGMAFRPTPHKARRR
jgi:hypothetical protein